MDSSSGFVAAEDVPSKVNYRQVGRGTGGRVSKGSKDLFDYKEPKQAHSLLRARVKRTTNSIPTRYETVIHVGQKERNAFGTRTNRFSYADNELPGPGNYHKDHTLVKDAEMHGSVSKKGYGNGFISKTIRFSDRSDRQSALDPAPGQYAVPEFSVRKGHSVAPVSRLFVKPKKFRDDPVLKADEMPGPGQYLGVTGIDSPPTGVKVPALGRRTTSVFASSAKRGTYLQSTVVAPPPGTYEAPSMFDTAPVRGKKGGRHRPSSTFASTSSRLGKGSSDASFAPGPGAYDPKLPPSKVDVVQTTSLFGNVGQDRWGNPYKSKSKTKTAVPGPGSYTRPYVKTAPAPATGSAFRSKTKRGFQSKGVQPPGPAFYAPVDGPGRRSFMLNAARRWV